MGATGHLMSAFAHTSVDNGGLVQAAQFSDPSKNVDFI